MSTGVDLALVLYGHDLELCILLPQLLKGWGYRGVLSCPTERLILDIGIYIN